MKNNISKLLPRNKPKMFSDSSLGIMIESLYRVRQQYEEYYHFDKVFVCVDEKTLEIIEVDYE